MKRIIICLCAAVVSCLQVFADAPAAKETVIIVPCHPDDIGAAVGFCLLARGIYDIHVIEFTHGERGCGAVNFTNGMAKAIRMAEEQAVCDELGVTLHWLDAVDGEAHADREVCDALSEYVLKYRPRALIGHYPVDIHGDHMMAGAAMLKAAFNVSTKDYKPEIYFFEQPYQTKAFHPDVYLDISQVYDQKLKVFRHYFSQSAGHRYIDGGISDLAEIEAFKADYAKRKEAAGERKVKDAPKKLHRTTCSAYHFGMRTSDLNQGARVEPYVSMFPRQQGQETVFDKLPQNPRRFNSRFQGAKVGKWAEIK